MKIHNSLKVIKEPVFYLELTQDEKDKLQEWAKTIGYDCEPMWAQDFLAQLQEMDEDVIA